MNRFHNQGRGDWKYRTATITAGINFISLNLRPVCVYSLTGRKHFKAKKPQKHICIGFQNIKMSQFECIWWVVDAVRARTSKHEAVQPYSA